MELIILSYNDEQKRDLKVESKYGKFNVLWEGELPLLGEKIDVELDIDQHLIWNKDIYLSMNDELQIKQSEEETIIQGKLEEVSDAGFAVLRLGNSISTFITEGTAFPINSNIQIKVVNVTAYPIDY